MTFTITRLGAQALIEDLGRPGYAHMGVSRSGAFDRRALSQGNALVGNRAEAPGIEILAGGLSLLAGNDQLIALTGAPASAQVDGKPVAHGRVLSVHRGQILSLGTLATGMRTYLSVAGGLEIAPVLGSASTDTLSGLGPKPLKAGDRLATGSRHGPVSGIDVPALIGSGEISIAVALGPREDWFTKAGIRTFLGGEWTVSMSSDRVGIRLEGMPIERHRSGELPSEPCVCGSIQVTADGLPIVFGPDHPVTGGYPVIAAVLDDDVDALAQVRPGQILRFTAIPGH